MDKQPTLIQILLAPLAGALFVVFLPLIGFIMVGIAISQKIKNHFHRS